MGVRENLEKVCERIREAIEAGQKIFGENRVQEALAKYEILGDDCRWHMVGHLQRNKVKHALRMFELIHSLDSLRLAEEIEKQAGKVGTIAQTLLQVNVSGEETKFGVAEDEVLTLIEKVAELQHVRIMGLMTIGPIVSEPEEVRPYFARLREIFEDIKGRKIPNVEMKYLSMGMTQDFEVAVEEGANMLRIGTAIFGPRS